MYFSDQITLHSVDTSLDSFGDKISSDIDTDVWANKVSATRSEFYQGKVAGINIDAVFEVHVEDYDNQQALTYNDVRYEIKRVYQKGEGVISLSCVVREVK